MILQEIHTKIAKGCAIIFMISLHLFAHDEWLQTNNQYITILNFGNTSLDTIFSSFGKICVSIYLFLSGYGIYKIYVSNKGFTLKDSLVRIKNIYINYVLILAIFIPIGYSLGVYKEAPTLHKLIVNILCLEFYYNSFAWFIRLYFVLLLLFPFIIKALDKRLINNIMIICVLFITHIIISKIQFEINYWDIHIIGSLSIISEVNGIILWSMHFIVGVTFAKFNLFNILKQKLLIFNLNNKLFYLFIFIICILLRMTLPYKEELDIVYAPITIISLTSIIYNSKVENIFKFLGNHSTNLWLIHFYFTLKYFQNIIYTPTISILILIWSFLIMIPISIILNKILYIIRYSFNK